MHALSKTILLIATAAALPCLVMAGCGGSHNQPTDTATESRLTETGPVRVLVLDDPSLATAIEKEWRRADSDVEIEVRQQPAHELVATVPGLDADVIVYPAGLLGELVQRNWITAVPSKVLRSSSLNRGDILPLERHGSVMWGRETFALTFGSPQFTLIYRKDIFDDETLRKQLDLSVPRTWSDYQSVAERLANARHLGAYGPAEGVPWSGTVEPLGPGWAGQVLLARAAAYTRAAGRDVSLFNANTMEPLIDHAPFVKALTELVAAAEASSATDRLTHFSPHDAGREVIEGRAAMALCWPTRAEQDSQHQQDSRVEVAFALLPGATKSYTFGTRRWESRADDENWHVPLINVAGRIGSVTKDSPRPHAAFNLLLWLTSERNSAVIAWQSSFTTLFRTSQLKAADKWVDSAVSSAAANSYAEVIRQTNESELWLDSIRIPGRARYLEALDTAVHKSLAGEPPGEALAAAAARWHEITQELGVPAQREAYWRSLGVE